MWNRFTLIDGLVGVIFLTAVVRKFIRFEPPVDVTEQRYRWLAAKYRPWETLALLPALIFAAALGGAWFEGLAAIARLHLRSLGPSLAVAAPPELMWAAPAGILGLLSAEVPLLGLYRRLLGDAYEEYALYRSLKYRFDTWKAVWIVGYPMTILVLVIFGMDCYVRLTPDEIIVNPLATLGETRYTYRQVKAVEVVLQRRAPSGEIINRPYAEVEFQDGSRFDPYNVFLRDEPGRDLKLLKLIAQESRKQIQTVRSVDDRGS